MFLNSVQLGTAATFHTSGAEVESIWVFNPFRNWFILFTPFGLGVTAVLVLLVCLITKKGYIFSPATSLSATPAASTFSLTPPTVPPAS